MCVYIYIICVLYLHVYTMCLYVCIGLSKNRVPKLKWIMDYLGLSIMFPMTTTILWGISYTRFSDTPIYNSTQNQCGMCTLHISVPNHVLWM